MSFKKAHNKIGILGGGQLARMLALSAHNMGIQPVIFSGFATDPAAQVSADWREWDGKNYESLKKITSDLEVLTFESEFYDAHQLSTITQELGLAMWPKPELMADLQDRLTQKKMLITHKIPTSDFLEIQNEDDLFKASQKFKKGFVLKKRRGGYDGNGTFILKNSKNWSRFASHLQSENFGFIAEAFVPFKRELAIMLGQDLYGNFISFPLVESHQSQARCDWVKGPIKNVKSKVLLLKLKNFLKKINYVGMIGFEIFDTGSELLINEIAPRVHNSGHYSMNALSESQFDLHIKSVCGYKCTSPQLLSSGFAMANLLGLSEKTANWPNDLKGSLHWYGKLENRPGRKMGHLNFISTNPQKALQLALKERKRMKL